ncbi:hypothetical protein LO772_18825 [Yinghuangia sp. ASG 101]|uniref:hypothetical protein n=1 Tax=Yinghuangia sp. ASG 101 TaxID=2896848 RepID=UPI001E38A8AC|nr:hypothetical protein [Yinghuangia sp. ASG 101]UGQ09025.1 hypothetical protein LO772_18825 [Yinghuangia sp. ASG 101]
MSTEIDPSDVPVWPVVVMELLTDEHIRVDGDNVAVPPGADPRETAVAAVAATASLIGRPVRAEAREPDGTTWPLIITPDGRAVAAGPARRPPPIAKRRGFRGGVLRRPSARQRSEQAPSPLSASGHAAPETASEQPRLSPPPPAPDGPPGPETLAATYAATIGKSPETPGTSVAHVPPADVPEPDAETRDALGRILDELRLGRFAAARSRAQLLVDRFTEQRGRDDPATHAAGEVLAYATFVAGDPVRAARMYAGLALPRVGATGTVDERGAQLADNAHFCWTRAGDGADSRRIGERIVALRTTGWGADSPQARSARRLLEARTPVGDPAPPRNGEAPGPAKAPRTPWDDGATSAP